MTVTRLGRESYTIERVHLEHLDLDVLIRRYSDGTTTVATRPGKDQRWLTWSPEVELVKEPSEPAEVALAHYVEGDR